MVRIHKGWLAYGLAAALMTAGPFAFAQDQSQQNQDNQSDTNQQGQQQGQTQGQSGSSYGSQSGSSMRGQTQGQSMQGTKQNAQQRMDQEKQTLRDNVKKEIDNAQSQIDSFQSDLGNKTGAARARDEQLLKQAIEYRDALNVDLQAIDNAQTKDWNNVRTTANADLNRFKGVVRRVEAAQKAAPRQGATQKQPKGSTQQQPQGGSQQGGSGGSSDTNK